MKTKSIIGGLAAAGAVALAGCTAYARRYKLTDEDRNTPILGDDYINKDEEPFFDGGGCAIDINAPADLVWQHIKQCGIDRAGDHNALGMEPAAISGLFVANKILGKA